MEAEDWTLQWGSFLLLKQKKDSSLLLQFSLPLQFLLSEAIFYEDWGVGGGPSDRLFGTC